MGKGFSFETFAPANNIGISTIKEWAQSHPDFAAAKKEGIEACRYYWEKMGMGLAAGKLKNGSTGVWIYNMKCRFPNEWRNLGEETDKHIQINLAYDPNK